MAFECTRESFDSQIPRDHICRKKKCFSQNSSLYLLTMPSDVRFVSFMLYSTRVMGLNEKRSQILDVLDLSIPFGPETCTAFTALESLLCYGRNQEEKSSRFFFEYRIIMTKRQYDLMKSIISGNLLYIDALKLYTMTEIIHICYSVRRSDLIMHEEKMAIDCSNDHRSIPLFELYLKLNVYNAYESGCKILCDAGGVTMRCMVR